MQWRVEILNEIVMKELDELPVDMRAKLDRIIHLIEELGLHNVREPYVKPLQDKLWEMRVKGRDGIARAIYVTVKDRRIVILHAFRKKTQKNTQGRNSNGPIQIAGIRVMTIPFSKLRKKWRQDPEFRKEYATLEPEFALAKELIDARADAGLSQEDVAERMGTSQPAVARLESGHKPSIKTLEKYAEAVGKKVEIHLVAG